MKLPLGFLKDCTEMLCERYPRMNRDYLQSISEVLLSSCCWNIETVDAYSTLYPNIWVQMISPSGDGKTLPIDHFLILVIDELEKQIETEDTLYKLWLSDYTKESLQKFLSNEIELKQRKGKEEKPKRVIYTYGTLYKDEATMFLSSAMHKNYMADIVGVESKLYDGKLGRKITTSRGLEEVSICYKTSIAATTPAIYELMKDDAFIQGGWNRYDMIVGSPISPEEVEMLPEDFFYGIENKDEITGIVCEYASKLRELIQAGKIYVRIDDEASLMWREYEVEVKKRLANLDDFDLRRGYLQRQAEKALKRAILYTISEAIPNISVLEPTKWFDQYNNSRSDKQLLCWNRQMEVAIENQEEFYQYWLKMLSERQKKPPSGKVTTNQAERNYFKMHCLDLKKRYGIFSRKLIIEATQWNDGDKRLTSNIDSAKVEGKLRIIFGDESRAICQQHRRDNDAEWFERMKISPSYKNPPCMYEWVGEDD